MKTSLRSFQQHRVIIRFGPPEENCYIQLLKTMGYKSIGCTLDSHSFHFTPLTQHCIWDKSHWRFFTFFDRQCNCYKICDDWSRFSPGVTPLISMEFTHIPGLSLVTQEGQYLIRKTLRSYRGHFSQVADIMISHTTPFANQHFTNI